KAEPPGRTPLLEAAATAAVALCLDERAQPGGEWHDAVHAWVSGHIRKVARRARGAHWQAAPQFPRVTGTVGGAQVPAWVPGRAQGERPSADPRPRPAAGRSRPRAR